METSGRREVARDRPDGPREPIQACQIRRDGKGEHHYLSRWENALVLPAPLSRSVLQCAEHNLRRRQTRAGGKGACIFPAKSASSCTMREFPTEDRCGMPIYEYQCCRCDDRFEKLVFRQEDVSCPKCGGEVRRLMSACSFKTGGAADVQPSGSAKSGCSSCSATSCASCH